MIWPIFTLSGIFWFLCGMLLLESFNHIFFPVEKLSESNFLGKLVLLFSQWFSVALHFIAHFRLDFNSKIIYPGQNIIAFHCDQWPYLLLLYIPSVILYFWEIQSTFLLASVLCLWKLLELYNEQWFIFLI